MRAALDHTIVCSTDRQASIDFYTRVLGFEYGGRVGRFEVVLVNDRLGFDFVEEESCSSRHFAFVLDTAEFDAVFARLKSAGIAFGDGPGRVSNMRGPGRSTGTLGRTYSVYFTDPSGHILEILTYDRPKSAA